MFKKFCAIIHNLLHFTGLEQDTYINVLLEMKIKFNFI